MKKHMLLIVVTIMAVLLMQLTGVSAFDSPLSPLDRIHAPVIERPHQNPVSSAEPLLPVCGGVRRGPRLVAIPL